MEKMYGRKQTNKKSRIEGYKHAHNQDKNLSLSSCQELIVFHRGYLMTHKKMQHTHTPLTPPPKKKTKQNQHNKKNPCDNVMTHWNSYAK